MKNNKNKWLDDLSKSKQIKNKYETISGLELDVLYSPNKDNDDFNEKLGYPGQYPYTRGVHANMYRGKMWTMRQFSGFGSAEETNKRFKYLLENGQTGLSVAFDMPTLMGYDADHSLSEGEVGKCGVSISSLKDMEKLFDGIDLEKVSVSQTINGPSIILLAFFKPLWVPISTTLPLITYTYAFSTNKGNKLSAISANFKLLFFL